MKNILAGLIVIFALTSAHAEQNIQSNLAVRGFAYADATAEQTLTLDDALPRLLLVQPSEAMAISIDQAAALLWESINIAVIQTPRACTEYKDYFWFSRLDTALPDDQTYKSGFAVKIRTGSIYRWEV